MARCNRCGKWNCLTAVVHATVAPPTVLVRFTSAPGWMPAVCGTDDVTAVIHSDSRVGFNMTPAVSDGSALMRTSWVNSIAGCWNCSAGRYNWFMGLKDHARRAIVLAAMCAATTPVGASRLQAARVQEFVGTMPCGPEMRAFIGGLGPDAPCHAVTWKLSLDPAQNGRGAWRLSAVYGVPPASNPNLIVDGPRVALDGTWTSDTAAGRGRRTTYRLTTGTPQRVLSFANVADGLVHALDTGGRLMIGTAGWSYTLNDPARAERSGNPLLATDMSYTISPISTGSSVFAVFEGRTPCAGIRARWVFPRIRRA